MLFTRTVMSGMNPPFFIQVIGLERQKRHLTLALRT